MSAAILTAGKLVFAAMGIAAGVKLAGAAKERGAWGLHTVALAAICAGGIGILLMPISTALESYPVLIAAEAGVRVGMLLLCVFIAGTFRPTPVGWVAAAIAGIGLVAAIVWDVSAQGAAAHYDYALASSHANQLSIAVPFAWAAFESVRLWLRGRRRLELGLADAAVVRGYLLWSVATACFVGICGLAMLAGVMASAGASTAADVAHAMRGFLYLGITAAMWAGLFRKAPTPEATPASS